MMKCVSRKVGAVLCAAAVVACAWITGCEESDSAENKPSGGSDKEEVKEDVKEEELPVKIDYTNSPNGTLIVKNNTNKSMVLFEGENLKKDTILGGVRARSTRAFDVSDKADFSEGGWIVIKGVDESEYLRNRASPSKARIEYSTMATYHEGEEYKAVINPAYTRGEYCFTVTNNSDIGIEIEVHNGSPIGEQVAYIAPNKQSYIYCKTQSDVQLYPVYVYYSKETKTVTKLKTPALPTSFFVKPLPVDGKINSYTIPEEKQTLEMISKSGTIPYAYITATNTVPNQDVQFRLDTKNLKTRGGQETVSEIPLTFEIELPRRGEMCMELWCLLCDGYWRVPVMGENGFRIIKSGYDYDVTISLITDGTDKISADSYKAIISEGTRRDISSEIKTLPQQ